MSGPMNVGHHAMLKFPDAPGSGRIATSRFRIGQVFPFAFEAPAEGGYSILKPGAEFRRLDRVPTVTGERADLTRFPARRGFEDLVQILSDPRSRVAWTAVTFPKQRYTWFALKDPAVLSGTIFWISNGGRHYAPWNGRHVNVIGFEEVTSYFHLGLAESARRNPFSDQGFPTVHRLSRRKPLTVNYITAAVPTPARFDRVARIRTDDDQVILESKSGQRVRAPLDVSFLHETC
jgi:hypothetical protein